MDFSIKHDRRGVAAPRVGTGTSFPQLPDDYHHATLRQRHKVHSPEVVELEDSSGLSIGSKVALLIRESRQSLNPLHKVHAVVKSSRRNFPAETFVCSKLSLVRTDGNTVHVNRMLF